MSLGLVLSGLVGFFGGATLQANISMTLLRDKNKRRHHDTTDGEHDPMKRDK